MSVGKLLEVISYDQKVSFLYKLTTSSKGSDDLSNSFDRDRKRRQRE